MHSGAIRVSPRARGAVAWRGLALASLLSASAIFPGCQSPRPFPPADLAAPDWEIRHGQAVWRPDKNSPEIAGELLLAIRSGDAAFVQFTKTPFPLVTAQKAAGQWEVLFGPEGQRFSGRGTAPARLIWLHLDDALFRGAPPPRRWSLRHSEDQWRFEHRSSGETLEGYLDP
jgi:hypothetical protein